MSSHRLRSGEVAIELPATYDAGIYFIGRIRTPWARRDCPKNSGESQAACAIEVEAPPGLTVVAVDGDRVLGTAKMGPNRPGPGSHVSTASFMVAADARGRGVGTALCRFALDWARDRGYAGMQFNAVVESNRAAVELYERLGFRIVGTVPGAFAHPTLGRVGLHVMYREL